MNFIYYTVIARSNFMKRIIPLHPGYIWVWQIGGKIFNFFLIRTKSFLGNRFKLFGTEGRNSTEYRIC